ncbi:hypothetical protein DNTS_003537 [Danionella cerebrum]|uniref:THAP domain-containing protein 1 n=1 Tax=Danionella cerebrum TaxID=2873325 RepID=A0A553QX28_9TELE|nr:hypothetical protein DNTS_003537 [Danionella translucida]TRY94509.1 hypothetical protein DNTS_003537 [Danionella translucida]
MSTRIKRRCSVPGCTGTKHLFYLPADPALKTQWVKFIFNEELERVWKNTCVCHLHFSDHLFENKGQVDTGFAKKLLLRRGALPTIFKVEQAAKINPKETAGAATDSGRLAVVHRVFTKEENEEVRIGETFQVKDEEIKTEVKDEEMVIDETVKDSLQEQTALLWHAWQPLPQTHFQSLTTDAKYEGVVDKVASTKKRAKISHDVLGEEPATHVPAVSVTTATESSQLPMIQYPTYQTHASMYLEPAVIYSWKTAQEEVLKKISRSAKYGSYSLMHLECNRILDIQLVQVRPNAYIQWN